MSLTSPALAADSLPLVLPGKPPGHHECISNITFIPRPKKKKKIGKEIQLDEMEISNNKFSKL